MEINDSFRVNRPIDDTWKVLLDIERIAPSLPGAELQEVEGDEYRGVVKVKVGPNWAGWPAASHTMVAAERSSPGAESEAVTRAPLQVRDFTATDWMDPKHARRTELSVHYGVAAAKQALADSGLEVTDENREEIGVIFSSGAGGQSLMTDSWIALQEKGPRAVPPTFIANALVDSTSGLIAIETGAIGHNLAVVSACSTGTHSVGEAAEAIRRGDCIAIIAGSTEAPLLEAGHAGFTNMRGMGSPRPGSDSAASTSL